jgi:hypothetical protein
MLRRELDVIDDTRRMSREVRDIFLSSDVEEADRQFHLQRLAARRRLSLTAIPEAARPSPRALGLTTTAGRLNGRDLREWCLSCLMLHSQRASLEFDNIGLRGLAIEPACRSQDRSTSVSSTTSSRQATPLPDSHPGSRPSLSSREEAD